MKPLRSKAVEQSTLSAPTHAMRPDGRESEAVYRQGRLTASCMHYYFPSNPEAAARLCQP